MYQQEDLSTGEEDEEFRRGKKSKRITKKYKKCKKKRTQVGEEEDISGYKNTEQESPKSESLDLYKTPGQLKLEGSVAKLNRQYVHDRIYTDLVGYRDHNKEADLFQYLDNKLDFMVDANSKKNKKCDFALMTFIQGCRAASWLSGDPETGLKKYEALKQSLSQYNMKYLDIVSALLSYNYFVLYMDKSKPGLAYEALEDAKHCLSGYTPSSWTSLLLKMECRLYDQLALIQTKNRLKWQSMAIESYKKARYHSLQEDQGHYFPVMYTVDIMYITMDMPTVDTTRDFRNTDIILERLNNFIVSEAMLDSAEQMLHDVSKNSKKLSPSYEHKVIERILYIGKIYLYIRKAQLCSRNKSLLSKAKLNAELAIELYEAWSVEWGIFTDSEFQYCSNLPKNVKYVLDTLQWEILLRMHATEISDKSKEEDKISEVYTRFESSEEDIKEIQSNLERQCRITSDEPASMLQPIQREYDASTPSCIHAANPSISESDKYFSLESTSSMDENDLALKLSQSNVKCQFKSQGSHTYLPFQPIGNIDIEQEETTPHELLTLIKSKSGSKAEDTTSSSDFNISSGFGSGTDLSSE